MQKLYSILTILLLIALSGCTQCVSYSTSRYSIHVVEPCCAPKSSYNPIRFHDVPMYYSLPDDALFEAGTKITPIPEDAKTIYSPLPF